MSTNFFDFLHGRPLPQEENMPSMLENTVEAPSPPKRFWALCEGLGNTLRDNTEQLAVRINRDFEAIGEAFEAAGVAAVTHAAANVIRFNPEEMENLKLQHQQQLRAITGSDHLNALLLQAVPRVLEEVRPEIESLDNPIIKAYLKGQLQQGGLLFTLFQVLLPQILCNLAGTATEEEAPGNARLLAIFPRLVDLIEAQAEDIHLQMHVEMERIDSTLSREEQKQLLLSQHPDRIREIFMPLSDSFLAQALPRGAQDLPLVAPLDAVMWGMLKNRLFPDLLFTLYWMVADFQIDRRQAELREAPHGELLDRLAEAVPLATEAFGLPLVEMCSPLIAQAVLNGIAADQVEDPEGLGAWLQNLFAELATHECPTTQQLVAQIGLCAQAFFSHLMANLANTGGGNLPVISQCSLQWNAFVVQHENEIDARLVAIGANDAAILEDPALQSLFQPLCIQLLESLKIRNSSDLPIPEFFKELGYAQLKLKGTQALISLYTQLQAHKRKEEEVESQLRAHYGVEFPQISAALDRFIESKIDALPNYSAVLSNVVCNAFSSQLLAWNPEGQEAIPAYLEEQMPFLRELFEAELAQPTPAAKELVKPFLRAQYLQLLAKEVGIGIPDDEFQRQVNTRFDVVINVLNGIGACFSEMHASLASEEDAAARIEAMHVPTFVADQDKETARVLQRQIADLKKGMFDQLEIYERDNDLEAVRGPLAECERHMHAAESALNALQKRSLRTLSAQIVPLMGLDQLGAPPLFVEGIKNVIAQNLLPEILVNVYNLASDANKLNRTLLQGLRSLNTLNLEIEMDAHFTSPSRDSIPNDPLQQRLEEACSIFISQIVELSTDSLQSLIINSRMVHAFLVEALAAALRQQLSQPLFKEILMLEGELPEVAVAAESPADSLVDPTEQLLAGLRAARNLEKDLEEALVSMAIKGASDMPVHAFSNAWRFVSKKMENLLSHFGCFGDLIMSLINFIMQGFILQVIGTLLAYILRALYDQGLMLAEPYLRGRVRNLLQALHMNVNKNIIHRVTSDVVCQLRNAQQSAADNLS